MDNDNTVNKIQAEIIWQLSKRAGLRFSEIRNKDVPSDQFSYHLRQLLKYNVVEKDDDGKYSLTVTGSTRSLMLDARSKSLITQGFVAVRVVVTRQSGSGQTEYLIQKRGRVPYLGYLGEPGGKVLFGDDVLGAARRNVEKETGLTCELELKGVVHYKDKYQGVIQQDKFFFVATGSNPKGNLKVEGETGVNAWMTMEELLAAPKIHSGVLEMIEISKGASFAFSEQTFVVDEY